MAKSSFFSGTGTTSNDVDSVTSSKAAAAASATSAATSETNAAASASSATTSATNASTSATSASNSATAAATSETNAASSETSASTSATNAATSETNAATSATNAATSETNAATSATNAATSEANASTSATAAATSAASVGTQATDAAASATAAATSEANAATSETNAATSETNAATSETNASTSATSAAASATSASTDAATASTAATNASTSATSASTSATNAASSATAAAASQTAAAASAASAATAYDTFDDRYLGSKTADPTVDNDGNALVSGALYFNSTANEMRVYDGANWIAATSAGNASLLEYKYTATSGQTTFSGVDDSSNTLSYTQDNLIVTLNGVMLENGTDYTASTGTSVVLASGAAANDELNVIAFKSFTTADMVSSANGGTFYNDVSIQGDLTFGDNDKAIFGAGSDLQIYHDGSHSYIDEQGTGSLQIRGTNLNLKSSTNETYLYCVENGEVGLQYDNALKLATTSTGIDVTGTVTADGLTVAQSSGANILLESTTTGATTGDIFGEIEFKTNDSNSAGIKGKIDSYSEGAVGNGALRLFTGDTTGLYQRMNIASNGDISFYEDTGTTAKFFWDASAESLGIGTSSIQLADTGRSVLEVNGSTNSLINLKRGDANSFYIQNYSTGVDFWNSNNTFMRFVNNSSEAMRIDSSGNLLVGKTATNSAVVGAELNPAGIVFATRDSNVALLLNRKTSDGDIAVFQKDGTTVGSIGNAGTNLVIGDGQEVGLRFSAYYDAIYPVNGSTYADANGLIDLGRSGSKFRNAYLSGGVYLGGTGAANKLDDYEEGTWTPSLQNVTVSYTSRSGTYTKIGRLVFATMDMDVSSLDTSDVSGFTVTLPFAAPTGDKSALFSASIKYNESNSLVPSGNTDFLNSGGKVNGSTMNIRAPYETGGGTDPTYASLNSSGSIVFSIMYYANA